MNTKEMIDVFGESAIQGPEDNTKLPYSWKGDGIRYVRYGDEEYSYEFARVESIKGNLALMSVYDNGEAFQAVFNTDNEVDDIDDILYPEKDEDEKDE